MLQADGEHRKHDEHGDGRTNSHIDDGRQLGGSAASSNRDLAVMGADIYESYVAAAVSAMALGLPTTRYSET